jgi:hypothetical protein
MYFGGSDLSFACFPSFAWLPQYICLCLENKVSKSGKIMEGISKKGQG